MRGHRIAFDPDGEHLFVSSGERQQGTPAQDTSNTLGTIVRLTPDGDPAPGNPLADRGGAAAQIWSWGHRNSPGNLEIYSGDLFEDWAGDALIGGLSGMNLVHVAIDGDAQKCTYVVAQGVSVHYGDVNRTYGNLSVMQGKVVDHGDSGGPVYHGGIATV